MGRNLSKKKKILWGEERKEKKGENILNFHPTLPKHSTQSRQDRESGLIFKQRLTK